MIAHAGGIVRYYEGVELSPIPGRGLPSRYARAFATAARMAIEGGERPEVTLSRLMAFAVDEGLAFEPMSRESWAHETRTAMVRRLVEAVLAREGDREASWPA